MNRCKSIVIPAILAGLIALAGPSPANTFTVDSAGDESDVNPGDGVALTSEGFVTLRAAIEEANAFPEFDTINFAVPFPASPVIQLGSSLPIMTGDGTTINGAGITLDGGFITGGPVLRIGASNINIFDLTITNAPQDAIQLNGNGAANCQISRCKIGNFGPNGENNGGSGISILNGANNNTIGGFTTGDGNTIAGNAQYGIYINGFFTEENEVVGNRIGIDDATSNPLPNLAGGVFISGGASQNVIGGNLDTQGNIIAGNGVADVSNSTRGVHIEGFDTFDNIVQGNRIGVDQTGNPVYGHEFQGVFIQDASGNLIGGTGANDQNIIAGNGGDGVQVNGGNAQGNSIRRNSIYENSGAGIQIDNPANGSIAAPAFITVSPDAGFNINGSAGSNNTVELFVDSDDEGRTYVATLTADVVGDFSASGILDPYVGMNLTTTQTDASGNTSMFSAEVAIGTIAEGEGEGEGEIEGETACFDVLCASAAPDDSDGDGLIDCFEINCLNTNPNDLDSDDDGLPDNFEVDNGFDPTGPDESQEDPDCDGLTNLEEFLGKSDPRDSASPQPTFYVSPTGFDAEAGGSKPFPWRTLNFAMSQVQTKPGSPVRIYLFGGSYTEDVEFKENVIVTGPVTGVVSFKGNFIGAANTELALIRLSVPDPARPGLVLPGDGPMIVRDVQFIGTGLNNQNGILVPEQSLGDSLIADSSIQRFAVGINVLGPRPLIRRTVINNTTFAGVYLQKNSGKGTNDNNLGDETDPDTGFNTFGEDNDGDNVVNDTTETVKMENNDWSTNDANEADASIDGPADFIPFLQEGLGILGASLAVTVWDATTLNPIENASIDLFISSFGTVTANNDGTYLFPSVISGNYTISVDAPGYVGDDRFVTIGEAEIASQVFALAPLEGIHTADQDANNVIDLSELLRIIQFFNTGAHSCQGGTEDGYAPGAGDESCAPHDSDYAPQDWVVNLSEVLRAIQFYNFDGYFFCPEEETEDTYCPGTPE